MSEEVFWTKRWMDLCCFISNWSKDRSRQIAAVIVDDRNVLLSIGWNGFPRGINDNVESRHKRPEKYLWAEHAERNAIYNAAAKGVSLLGSTMYMPWYPCHDCARAIIQSGISELVCVEPDWGDESYKESFAMIKELFNETSVTVRYVDGYDPPERKPDFPCSECDTIGACEDFGGCGKKILIE